MRGPRAQHASDWLDAHPNAFGAGALALAVLCAAAWVWTVLDPTVGTSGNGRRTESLLGLPVVAVGLLVLAVRAFGQPAARGERAGRSGEHSTSLLDLAEHDPPAPGDDPPRYLASCECGWVGDPHHDEADARAEARAHTA